VRPEPSVREYITAVRAGDAARVRTLLDEESRARVTDDEVRQLLTDNRAELEAQARDFDQAPANNVQARARVTLDSGEVVALVLEGERWVIDSGVLDALSLRTPLDAVRALRQSLQRRSWAGLERVLARLPRAQIEADFDSVVEDTADELDLVVDAQGSNRAVVRTTSGRRIELVREGRDWRVLSIGPEPR